MAMAVMKGVLKSARMANLRRRIQALDAAKYGGVYRLGRNAQLLHERLQPRAISGRFASAVCSPQRIETRLAASSGLGPLQAAM